ncbi:hypothetical protein [Nostoc sp.]
MDFVCVAANSIRQGLSNAPCPTPHSPFPIHHSPLPTPLIYL